MSYFVSETPISYKEKKRAINERELKMVVNNFFLTRFGIANSAV